MNQQQLEQMVRAVLQEITAAEAETTASAAKADCPSRPTGAAEINLDVPDITQYKLQETLLVENPINRDAYMDLKRSSPARLGVGRAGPRLDLRTFLRIRADHAASMDSVQNDVPESTIEELGLFSVQSSAASKADYLMNPNAGRVFDPETAARIKETCRANPQVQIIVTDGLSSIAVENNIRDILPSLLQGLKGNNLQAGTNLFVKFGRVGIMDAVCEILGPEVTILFVGERPGLITNESLSCYMTYKGYPGVAESARTVVSNIYQDGTPPSEAGAHIADLAKKMIERKASGLDLKL